MSKALEDRLALAEALLASAEAVIIDYARWSHTCYDPLTSSWLKAYEHYKDSVLHSGELHR